MSQEPYSSAAVEAMHADETLAAAAREFVVRSCEHRYSYNFSWLGRPIIQYPQDLIALQEIIWADKPDLIVETGIAHGGSAIFYASLLQLLGGDGRVVAIDIDIRRHNREAIERHPVAGRIVLLEGSSVDPQIVDAVRDQARGRSRVMVVLDSLHTHEHVRAELAAYAPLVRRGAHLVVLDTVIEQLPERVIGDRPWGPGDNPLTAVQEFLRSNDRFVRDREIEDKLLISVAPSGYLRCVKD